MIFLDPEITFRAINMTLDFIQLFVFYVGNII